MPRRNVSNAPPESETYLPAGTSDTLDENLETTDQSGLTSDLEAAMKQGM